MHLCVCLPSDEVVGPVGPRTEVIVVSVLVPVVVLLLALFVRVYLKRRSKKLRRDAAGQCAAALSCLLKHLEHNFVHKWSVILLA